MTHVKQTATAVAASRLVPRATLAMGTMGALVGGTVAAAKHIRSVKQGEMEKEEAVRGVVREAAGTGLATAAATAVVGTLGMTGFVAGIGIVALATGTKYLWDMNTGQKKSNAVAVKAEQVVESENVVEPEVVEEPAPPKTTVKKTTTKKTITKK
ncbi:MAG: hypothetical protein CSA21_05725 [Deltaproteobacteria bacterium]|nr:MAG: hypothetical protein CSA21_05725 [Deltaproteobacteria bacterium]